VKCGKRPGVGPGKQNRHRVIQEYRHGNDR
jgi:hypothetical protein